MYFIFIFKKMSLDLEAKKQKLEEELQVLKEASVNSRYETKHNQSVLLMNLLAIFQDLKRKDRDIKFLVVEVGKYKEVRKINKTVVFLIHNILVKSFNLLL